MGLTPWGLTPGPRPPRVSARSHRETSPLGSLNPPCYPGRTFAQRAGGNLARGRLGACLETRAWAGRSASPRGAGRTFNRPGGDMDPTAQTQATLDALTARLAELEAAHATQQKRSAALEHENERLSRPVTRFGRKPAGTVAVQTAPAERSSRRRMLGTAAKVAVATAGAGVLAEQVGTRTAFADNYGNFSSSVSGTPAVISSGTNGAGALNASSDSGFAIAAYSTTGSAIYASGGGGVGVQATGANQGVSGSTGAISARASTAPTPATTRPVSRCWATATTAVLVAGSGPASAFRARPPAASGSMGPPPRAPGSAATAPARMESLDPPTAARPAGSMARAG